MLFEDERNEGFGRIPELVEFSTNPSIGIARALLQNRLQSEFHTQINNVDMPSTGTMYLKRGTRDFLASIADGAVVDISVRNGLQQTTIYLDDPFVIDYYLSRPTARRYLSMGTEDHRLHASRLLHPLATDDGDVLGAIMTDKKITEITRRLDSVVSGFPVASRKHGIAYRRSEGSDDLDIRNISSGVKTFASIKILLREDRIHDGGILILDEPENHMHPQWRLV